MSAVTAPEYPPPEIFAAGKESGPNGERADYSGTYCAETRASQKHPERNEDAYCAGPDYSGVFDAVGSCRDSEKAATIAAAYCNQELSQLKDELDLETAIAEMRSILCGAAVAMTAYAAKEELSEPIATAAIIEKTFTDPETGFRFNVSAHCGDCRSYLVSNGKIKSVTLDHNAATATLLAGGETPDEGMRDAQLFQKHVDNIATGEDAPGIYKGLVYMNALNNRNCITSALTSGGSVPDIRIAVRPVDEGDVLLLTSDGVHDNLTRRQIAAAVARTKDAPLTLAGVLVEEAANVSTAGTLRSKADDITASVRVIGAEKK